MQMTINGQAFQVFKCNEDGSLYYTRVTPNGRPTGAMKRMDDKELQKLLPPFRGLRMRKPAPGQAPTVIEWCVPVR